MEVPGGAARLKVVPTGLKHGTVTAVIAGRPFELTTLRRDVETDGRHAVVAYTDDWLEDASRRDFTFNALYADPDGTLYDPFDGRADLAAAHVRFIGDADQRIAEDRLRILRFFRFHAWYGKPPFDSDGFMACRRNAGGLRGLSGRARAATNSSAWTEAPAPADTVGAMRDSRHPRSLASRVYRRGEAAGADRAARDEPAASVRRLASLLSPTPMRRRSASGCGSRRSRRCGSRVMLAADPVIDRGRRAEGVAGARSMPWAETSTPIGCCLRRKRRETGAVRSRWRATGRRPNCR